MAVKDATEFISVTAIEEVGMVRESTGRVEGPVRWIPPAHGGMKVKCVGFLVDGWRNSWCGHGDSGLNGQFCGCVIDEVGLYEAGAWRAAMEFARLLGIRAITVEGDSHQLVRILNNKMKCPDRNIGVCWRYQKVFARV